MPNIASRWLDALRERIGALAPAAASMPGALCSPASPRPRRLAGAPGSFAGRWFTSFGAMTLTQSGAAVEGRYGPTGEEHKLKGTVEGDMLSFSYDETRERGTGHFRLSRWSSFSGDYLADGAPFPRPWRGQREFHGMWETSLGPLRLVQDDAGVKGFFDAGGASRFDGRIEADRLVFTALSKDASFEGSIGLEPGHTALAGDWRKVGQPEVMPFLGRRVVPTPGVTWLIVLEAHWQGMLAERDFAFGNMLRELFARLPHVLVRQRYFQDEASLTQWCREALFLPEPSIIVVASHGLPDGVTINGTTIDTRRIIAALSDLDDLTLLHFSACLIGQDSNKALASAPFPVSGYTTSVNWGQSALIEFAYLDMILAKGLTPRDAAAELVRQIGFAGDETPEGCPYPGAGFRYFDPGGDGHAVA